MYWSAFCTYRFENHIVNIHICLKYEINGYISLKKKHIKYALLTCRVINLKQRLEK